MLQHIALHVSLCDPMLAAPPEATVPIRVRISDRTGQSHLDRVFKVERGYDNQKLITFDVDNGTYRLQAQGVLRGAHCSADTFVQILPEVDRSVAVALEPATPGLSQPFLFAGSAPQSFLYAKPTYVLLKPSVTCKTPVSTPLPSNVDVEYDQDAYYASIESDRSATPQAVVALRLKTPTSQYHYVRIPIPYPQPWAGWPNTVRLNVTEDMLDGLAGEPVDTLLCPKMWKTSAG